MMDLINLRKSLGLTQSKLASILQVNQKTISQYELGKRDLTLKKIAKYKQKLIEHFGAEKIETLFNGVPNQSIVDNNSSYKKNMEFIVKKYNLTAEEQENLVILPVTEVSRLDNIQVGDIILALKNPKLTIKGGIFIFLVDGKELMANLYRKKDVIVMKNKNAETELKEEDINLIYEAKAIIREL